MVEFNLDSFLEGLEKDKSSDRGSGDRITKILMNTKDNQGTIVIVPFMNKKTNNFYLKLSDVKEWNGSTTMFDSGQIWYKILPDEYYGELSQEDQNLLAEINGLYNAIEEYEAHDYDVIRHRNYTLIYGILCSHKNTSNKNLTDNIDKPCLFIFPSISPINMMLTAVDSKSQAIGRKDWILDVLNPTNTGRDGVMSITFKKTEKPGYECSVGFEFNSKNNNDVIDPTKVFDEEVTKFFNDPIRDLVGWQGDGESYFNAKIMQELRNDLKLELNRLMEEEKSEKPAEPPVYENKNGQQDPMKIATPQMHATPQVTAAQPVYQAPQVTYTAPPVANAPQVANAPVAQAKNTDLPF